jgi:hypothetical protein
MLSVFREGVGRKRFRRLLRSPGVIQTGDGVRPARKRVATCTNYQPPLVYVCIGCKKLTCACNGASDDPRCDDCVVKERQC